LELFKNLDAKINSFIQAEEEEKGKVQKQNDVIVTQNTNKEKLLKDVKLQRKTSDV
jgi:hypothetical protein